LLTSHSIVGNEGFIVVYPLPNERCSRQALFGCGFAAMVIVCLQLN
jgi:hypothetical protein